MKRNVTLSVIRTIAGIAGVFVAAYQFARSRQGQLKRHTDQACDHGEPDWKKCVECAGLGKYPLHRAEVKPIEQPTPVNFVFGERVMQVIPLTPAGDEFARMIREQEKSRAKGMN